MDNEKSLNCTSQNLSNEAKDDGFLNTLSMEEISNLVDALEDCYD